MSDDDASAGSAAAHEVVLIRHGETEWSRSGRHTGRADVALTDVGRHEAARLAGLLAGRTFGLVLCSPLARARETYGLSGIGRAAESSDDLMEWDYGVYEGVSTAEVRRTIPGWTVWTHPITGGESVEEVGVRADRVIGRTDLTEGDVALFAHGQFLRVLAARWLGLSADHGRLLALGTATVSSLGSERETRVIRTWNQAASPVDMRES